MARIIPTDLSRRALAGGHTRELGTLAHLRDALPDDLCVYHGVHWTREYRSGTAFGEVDFVVVDGRGRTLLIEQKAGALEETPDGLVKVYESGRKPVAAQIHRALDGVRDKFRWQHGDGIELDYLLYCPDHRLRQVNAAGLDAAHIVDAGGDLCARIQALLAAVRGGDARHAQAVHGFFAQTLDLVPDIHAHVAGQERALARLTGPMLEVVDHLEMSPFRLRVAATAGSGKSLLAARFFEHHAGAGVRPLLLCFNRPLAELLRGALAGGEVNTFHGFCAQFLGSLGEQLDFARMGHDPTFWPEVLERVVNASVPPAWRFGALVIDEGQDFEPEWWEIARLFVDDAAPVMWLEDPEQNLSGRPETVLPGFVTWRSRRNYRSPESIARFAQRALPFAIDAANELPGLGVGVHGYDAPDAQPDIVRKLILELMRRGFAQEQIVIVSMRGARASVFSDLERIGDVSLKRFTGAYDGPHQVMTQGRVRVESIYRFKGQEAPAVILVDVDPPQDGDALARAQKLLFCGVTRATVRLDVVARTDNSYTQRLREAAL